MNNVVDLHPARLEENSEFVSDCCRYAENILSEEAVRKKWRFNNDTWRALSENEALIEAIELEKVRRVRSGQQKRERAQVLVTKAPDIAAKIMLDDTANNRHRLDACKVLDDFSATGPDKVPAADRFSIIINLGADVNGKEIVERFNKSIAPLKPGEIDPNDITSDSIDTNVLATITMKPTESGGGDNTI
jgi:hypothetical protein